MSTASLWVWISDTKVCFFTIQFFDLRYPFSLFSTIKVIGTFLEFSQLPCVEFFRFQCVASHTSDLLSASLCFVIDWLILPGSVIARLQMQDWQLVLHGLHSIDC